MDDKTIKKLQAEAVANLQKELSEADAREAKDPVRAEKRIFTYELGRARLKKNISQTKLAAITGMQQSDISRIESGKANPSLNTLLKIAKALDVNLLLD